MAQIWLHVITIEVFFVLWVFIFFVLVMLEECKHLQVTLWELQEVRLPGQPLLGLLA